jgi:glyoxalase family protein
LQVTGFHHITCIGSHPQQNLEFYSGILGLRLVKKTVHFDREEVYHLYYGDDRGRPGTVLTFFPFTDPEPAIRGSNSIQEISFAVPESSQDFWKTHLEEHRVDADFWVEEFGQPALRFRDHDGQRLKLVAVTDSGSRSCWQTGPILTEHAIRGLQGVRLGVIDADDELAMLTELLGLIYSAQRGNVTRLNFRMPNPESRIPGYVDVEAMPGVAPAPRLPLEGAPAMAGTTNHVAFATVNEQSQLEFRERLVDAGLTLTPVKDRRYFKSIYMIDRCGVRLEIATEGPGFTVDESPEQLGEALKLPPWLEHLRPVYEASLPELPSSIRTLPRWLSSSPGN